MSFEDDDVFDVIAHELDDGRTLVVDQPMPTLHQPLDKSPYLDPLQSEFEVLHRGAETAGKQGSKDEFYQFVEARIERAARAYAAAKHVGNPPSALGQILGDQALLAPNANAIVSQAVARWQGETAETGPVTITAAPLTPLAIAAGTALRPFVYVRWGSYGVNFLAEVDIGFGRQFTLNASMVEVDVAVDVAANANAAQVNLGASLSFRPMVRTASLIRSRYIDALGAGGTSTVVIPPFAVGLLPVQMSDASALLTLDFYDAAGTKVYSLIVNPGSLVTPVPLTSDVVRLVVTNGGPNPTNVRLPFELSI